MRHPARIRATFAIGLAAAIASSGCAGVSPTLDRWLGRSPSTADSSGVFYSAVDGLSVHASPIRSSAVVGRLPLHERVVRSKLQGGYAYVRAGRSGLEGWVDNSRLLWRLPTAGAPPAATAGEGEPGPAAGEAAEAAPAASEPVAPAAQPAGEPAKPPAEPSKPKPSVFDPF